MPTQIFKFYFCIFSMNFEVGVAAVEVTQNNHSNFFCSQQKHLTIVLATLVLEDHLDAHPLLYFSWWSKTKHVSPSIIMIH